MTTNDDSGAAFPIADGNYRHVGGMTLRQYYAGLAMQGLLAQTPKADSARVFAMQAVIAADALLAELKK